MSIAAKPCFLLAALAFAFVAQGKPRSEDLDNMAQRMRACETCHGEESGASRDGYYPRIAGKPAGYLFAQLKHFRDGNRHQDQMRFLLQNQTDDYLRAMAQYFSKLDWPNRPPRPRDTADGVMRAGEQLVRRGDPDRQLPACDSCHGSALTGLEPAVPGLLGLPYDYLVAQLGAWRQGARQASEPDCMALIARRLNAQDIEAVAGWLASRALPQPAHAVSGTPDSPMPCGSWEHQE